MKTAFKELHQWAKENPVKACVFSALTGILATWDGTRPYLTWLDTGPWVLLIISLCFTLSYKLVSALILSASILLLPSESKAAEKPQSAAVAAGVVVVVVGGVVVIYLVRFCQRAFPRTDTPPTNAPPSLESTDFYAASMTYSAIGNCYAPQTNSALFVEPVPTVFEFSGGFDTDFNFRMTQCRKVPSADDAVDLQEFVAELVPWGIRLGTGGESYYGLNGVPCSAADVPVTFGTGPTVDVARGDWIQTVVFEKSNDLVNWDAMLTMTISAEQRIKFSDAGTSSQVFYRCRPL